MHRLPDLEALRGAYDPAFRDFSTYWGGGHRLTPIIWKLETIYHRCIRRVQSLKDTSVASQGSLVKMVADPLEVGVSGAG
jgi:hypothetical protein